MPPRRPTVPTALDREPVKTKPHSAIILSIDTPTLIGAALRLGKRRLSRIERQRLVSQLNAHAAAGDPTARMTIGWLECRPDRLPAQKGEVQ